MSQRDFGVIPLPHLLSSKLEMGPPPFKVPALFPSIRDITLYTWAYDPHAVRAALDTKLCASARFDKPTSAAMLTFP